MRELSGVDEIMKIGAIVAIALWAAHAGYKKGVEKGKKYGEAYVKGFEDRMTELFGEFEGDIYDEIKRMKK